MMRVALGDAVRQVWVWSAAALVALMVALFTTWCLNFMVAIDAAPESLFRAMDTDRRGYLTVGSNLLVFSCLPAVVILGIVLSSVTAHTAVSQSLWRLGGASPAQMVRMIGLQAVIVCCAGTIGGVALSMPLQPMVNDLLIGIGEGEAHRLPTVYSLWAVVGSLVVLALVSVLAVVLPAWRAARRSPIEVRTAPERATGPGLGYLIVVLVVVVLAVLPSFASIIGIHVAEHAVLAAAVTLPLGQALVLTTALLAPWVLPALIAGWTRLVGPKSWTSWQLARHLAVARIAGSAATIAPLTLGLGLFASYGLVSTTLANLAPPDAAPNQVEGFVLLLPVAVVSAAGSIAVVMMAARQHTEDIVTMRSAGSTRAGTVGVMVFEAVIVTISAVLVAVVPSVAQYALLAYALGVHGESISQVGFNPLPAGGLALVTLAGMLLALLTAARSAWSRPLSEFLAER